MNASLENIEDTNIRSLLITIIMSRGHMLALATQIRFIGINNSLTDKVRIGRGGNYFMGSRREGEGDDARAQKHYDAGANSNRIINILIHLLKGRGKNCCHEDGLFKE